MMPRICAVLPCSAALARQIHHADTRRVISWGLGEYSSNTGDLYERETSSPPHSMHTHTHKCPLCTCKSCALCTRLLTAEHSPNTINSPLMTTFNMLHTANQRHLQLLQHCHKNNKCVCFSQHFPMQLILKQISSQGNFRLQHYNYSKFKARPAG